MIRTEVETLDQAIDVLTIQQRRAKAAATMKSKGPTLKQELGGARGQQIFKKRREKHAAEIAPFQEAVSEFEQRSVERVAQAIQLLMFSVEEMSNLAAVRRFHAGLNQSNLINIIGSLAKAIGQQPPTFSMQRMPVGAPKRYCIGCGAELTAREVEYCVHCDPLDKSVKIASDLRREHLRALAGTEREAKQLSKLINKVKRKVIEHEDSPNESGRDAADDGGDPTKDAGALEAGGREDDLGVGSAIAHRHRENNS